MSRTKTTEICVLALLALLFGAYGLWVIWQQSFYAIDGHRYFTFADDGLITLRYGWNLAHGAGLVWNPGERIEGITNPLWALQASVFSAFLSKRFLPLAMQLMAICWLLTTAWCFRQIVKTLQPSIAPDRPGFGNAMRVVAFLLPLSYSPLVVWGLRGMETSLQAALVACAVLVFLRASSCPSYFGSLLLGLACGTRPDCIIPSAVVLGSRFLTVIMKRHRWQDLVLETMPLVSVLLALTVFRWAYYGSPVPNTYVLKIQGMSMLERIRLNGIGYIKPFVIMSLPLILITASSLLVRPTMSKLTLAGLPATMLVYTVYVGGDAFDNWRFLAPYIPFAFLAVLFDLPHLDAALHARLTHKRLGRPGRHLCVALGVAFLLTIARPPMFRSYISQLRDPQADDMANINTAIWLNGVLRPSASVGVFYAGSIPFYSDFYAYDFLGKSDRRIATFQPDKSGSVSWNGLTSVPGHNKYDLTYSVLTEQPTYVQGLKWGRQNITAEALELYQPVPVAFRTWSSFSEHQILLRRKSPHVRWERIESQPTEQEHAELQDGPRGRGPS